MTNAALTTSGGGVTVWRRVWCGGGGGGRPAMVARLAAMATHASLRSRPFASRWPAPAQPRAESGTAAHSEQPAAGSRGGRPRPTTTEVDRPTRRYAQRAGQAAGGRTDEQVSARHEAASRADQAAGARRSAWTAAGQHSALGGWSGEQARAVRTLASHGVRHGRDGGQNAPRMWTATSTRFVACYAPRLRPWNAARAQRRRRTQRGAFMY